MKKILSFVLAAVALVFTACSNDETIETSGNGLNNKGMVLVATVSQQDSRAAIDVSQTFGKWTFTFTDNDKVVVGNNTINDYYTFTKSGDTFSSADAKVTSSDADWYAYYPALPIRKAHPNRLQSCMRWQERPKKLQLVPKASLSI